ncbi:MAG: cell wall-binding repeat-containing protein [Coriobacteriia bacterium]|nr:cell wall-binding repeat-containing protein [Coriobacteriia bacterium]
MVARLRRTIALSLSAVLVLTFAGLPAAQAVTDPAPLDVRAAGWSLQDSGVSVPLGSVYFIDESTGWMTGGNGTLRKTTNGGESWSARNTGTSVALSGVFFLDANTGWIVGDGGTILKSIDGGVSWTPQTSGTSKNLWGVQFVDENTGWAVGIPGGYGPPPPGEFSPILRTTDGGETWTNHGDIAHQSLQTMFFIDATTGWAAGNGTLIRSTDGGVTWEDIRPDDTWRLYWAPHFVDANTGWVVGDNGLIMRTTDGGGNWEFQDSGVSTELIDVYFVDANTGWVSGNGGLILATDDGGDTWVVQHYGGTRYLRDLYFVGANTGWGVGAGGHVVAYRWPLPPVESLEGEDRYATAVDVSRRAFPIGAETVVIATGANWPDALGGTALAGALNGPVLLVGTDVIPSVVTQEIDRLGVTNAIILGGTVAVGDAVEGALEAMLGESNVERIKGADRYETANAVALRVIAELGVDYDGMAFVATGGDFPDALAAAPLAARQHWPLFLAHPVTGLSAGTKAAMADVTDAIVLGGTAAVSSVTATQLATELSGTVERLWGEDRYATAVAVATYAVDEQGHDWDRVGITTGMNFPDALAGGVAQGKMNSVMLLTRPTLLDAYTAAALAAHKAEIDSVTFFGGANAVTQGVRDEVAAVLE